MAFKRGGDPLDTMRVGKAYLKVKLIRPRVGTELEMEPGDHSVLEVHRFLQEWADQHITLENPSVRITDEHIKLENGWTVSHESLFLLHEGTLEDSYGNVWTDYIEIVREDHLKKAK